MRPRPFGLPPAVETDRENEQRRHAGERGRCGNPVGEHWPARLPRARRPNRRRRAGSAPRRPSPACAMTATRTTHATATAASAVSVRRLGPGSSAATRRKRERKRKHPGEFAQHCERGRVGGGRRAGVRDPGPVGGAKQVAGAPELGKEPERDHRRGEPGDRVPQRGLAPPDPDRVDEEERPDLRPKQRGARAEQQRAPAPPVEVRLDREERERDEHSLRVAVRRAAGAGPR